MPWYKVLFGYYSKEQKLKALEALDKVNILDISQTIVQGYFNMMMIVDMQKSEKVHDEISTDLNKIGEELGVIIKCQREEIFNKMHRI